ncbi:Major facilitator superfamily [Neofusicoccum parvum]|nr:Major facilitator superfamily [Neofusicoccum parvum]
MDIFDTVQGHQSSAGHWKILVDQALVSPDIVRGGFRGEGTESSPYIVGWASGDLRNPRNWSKSYKWILTINTAIGSLAVSFSSSAYSGGLTTVMEEFDTSREVAVAGLSLFVLGFALGPLLWAPLSELYGRQWIFFLTFGAFTAFNAGAAGAQNIETLLLLRFFAGSFGSSPLTNAGGVIADLFDTRERGLAMSIFCVAPFLGPVLGPVAGAFLGETKGWRWIEGLLAIYSGACWILGTLGVPETYAPVLLRRRAAKLSKLTGRVYQTQEDVDRGSLSFSKVFRGSLLRPWVLLFREPIVLTLSIYLAIVYGILYMLFGAYPIVYQRERGWTAGIAGLPFLAVAIGMLFALVYTITVEHPRFLRILDANHGSIPPESRLPGTIVGGIALPIGLFWFAWTNGPSVPWPASVAAGIPFGFGMVLVFVGVINYLVDSYTIFAASVMAGNSVLRSLFGAAFPLFTVQMYEKLGIHWASTLAAFLALVCLPFPFLFFKHGHRIRAKCKYAAEAEVFMRMLREEGDTTNAEFSDGQEKTDTGRAEFSDGTYEDKEDISMDEP